MSLNPQKTCSVRVWSETGQEHSLHLLYVFCGSLEDPGIPLVNESEEYL